MGEAEQELVLRSQAGDPAAFETLVRQHQRMIHALTYRMTGSQADAEDLAQEAFLRAWEQLDAFRGAARFSTWLYRIAVNVCLNWQQGERRRAQVHQQAALEQLSTAGDRVAAVGEVASVVQTALLRLPAKQRAAIVLTIYQGLNHAEAAQLLDCSETTVSWRVFAAKRQLKKWLSAQNLAAAVVAGNAPTQNLASNVL